MFPLTNSIKETYLLEEQLSSNLSNKSKQGYVSLSPSRHIKSKIQANKLQNKNHQSQSPHPYEDTLNKVYIVQNQQNVELPIRTQQRFGNIPNYSLDEAVVKVAFSDKLQSVSSTRKKKLSVTKLFQNVDISNKKDSNVGNTVNVSSSFKYK